MQQISPPVRYLCRKGAKPLWEELYEDYYKELVRYGTHMCGSRELAEDLAQETFVKAMMHAASVEELSAGKRRAWLYRTFKNLFFDRCRRSALENNYISSLSPALSEDGRLQEVENAMLLQTVSPKDRAMFQLRYFDGYTAEEIARMMNLPAGTVRSRLSRCRKFLKDQLNVKGGNQHG